MGIELGTTIHRNRIKVNMHLINRTVGLHSDSTKSKLMQLFGSYTRCHIEPRPTCKGAEPGMKQSIGVRLLSDINDIFKVKNVSKLRTKSILADLYSEKRKQSAIDCNGKPISARQLNAILQNEFGLHSRDIRFKSGVFKGFYRHSIAKAWNHVRKQACTTYVPRKYDKNIPNFS